MNKTTSIKFLINTFLLLLINLFAVTSYAEGTPQVSPNPATSITALLTSNEPTGLISGSYFNCPDDNRVKFLINSTNESFYFGFDWYTYVASSPTRLTNLWWRIRTVNAIGAIPAGGVVASGRWDETGATGGRITTFAQASAGPNIGGSVPAGYTPLVFNPTAAGEYWIEYFRGTNATTPIAAGTRSLAPIFDFTVADNSGAFTRRPGRVYSGKWGLVAVAPTGSADPYSNLLLATAEPVFYSYTSDQVIVKIDFEAGFRPIAFEVAVNSYGVNPAQTNWTIGRRSINAATGPTLTNGYRVFLNIPDVSLFPLSALPAAPTFLNPAVSGCGPYTFNYNTTSSGDVRLLLDLDGVAGYQTPGPDRILEAFNVTPGNNTIPWDGLNGAGVAVPAGTNFNIALTLLRGRFNLPLYDAELNSNGIRIGIEAPLFLTNATMYWDDTLLTAVGPTCDTSAAATTQANNLAVGGVNNSFLGRLSPSHAWSGNGNPTFAVPAPAVAGNDANGAACDDFGNVRSINTWGWGAVSLNSNLNITLGCANLSISKGVSNASPLVGSSVTFTLTAQNLGTVTSSSTIVNDPLPLGYTYQSDNGAGAYDSISGNWTIGTLASGASTSLQIVAIVNATGPYTNTATIAGSQVDPVLGNNTSSITPTPINVIDAIDDPATTVASGATPTPAGSVLGNDTLNGVAVTIANTNVTPATQGPISVDADGNLTVAANTPSGTYTITYQLCEAASPANCDTATATVIVLNPIDAVDDPTTTVASGPAPTPAGSVLGNDTLNSNPATTSNTDVTAGSNGPLSVDADGNLTVAPNTPSGTYTITYELCETGAVPTNCDTATATVDVVAPIDAVDDTPAPINGLEEERLQVYL